jgi:hypothetical protein
MPQSPYIDRITTKAAEIIRRYDPENDLIAKAPEVTATDKRLLDMIEGLVIIVKDLQVQIDEIKEIITDEPY